MFDLLRDEGASPVGTVNHQDVQLLFLGEGWVIEQEVDLVTTNAQPCLVTFDSESRQRN
jgi:hypothetical protein